MGKPLVKGIGEDMVCRETKDEEKSAKLAIECLVVVRVFNDCMQLGCSGIVIVMMYLAEKH